VPIFASGGRLAYTLVAMGLSNQMRDKVVSELVETMRREAEAISARLYPGS